MKRKEYKILILENSHSQCLGIEKTLNCLGCFRIAPARSFDEFKKFTTAANIKFDIAVVNAHLVPTVELVNWYFTQHAHIRYILLYNYCGSRPVNHRFFSTSSEVPGEQNLNDILTASDVTIFPIGFLFSAGEGTGGGLLSANPNTCIRPIK